MRTGPKWRVYNVAEAALMLAYLSRKAGWRKIVPTNPNVSPQRRRQLLARAQEMAADIKARP
jgi:pyruvate-formate lyase-activating enzyme